jgi:hypothetical protein
MIYRHALRYFHDPDRSPREHLAPQELRELIGALPSPLPLLIRFSTDAQACVSAELTRAVLGCAGIRCLHLLDDEQCDARERLLLDGKALPPPLLCALTQTVRDREIILRRHPDTVGEEFPFAERRAAMLLRLASEQGISVILMQSDDTHFCDALLSFAHLPSLTVASATDKGGRAAAASITRSTEEVITHALGAEVIRTLSDACAKCGSRLTVLPRASIRRHSITPASQVLDCHALTDVHLPSGAAGVADAAALVLQLSLSLRRRGLPISEQHIRQGLTLTVPSLCFTPISIQPLVLLQRAQTPTEWEFALRELTSLEPSMPRPLTLVSDAPPSDKASRVRVDSLIIWEDEAEDAPALPVEGSVVAIGSPVFLKKIAAKRKKISKKA